METSVQTADLLNLVFIFCSILQKRGLASQCPRPLGQAAEVQSTVLNNKLVVATAEASLPITRVSIVLR